MNHDTINTVCNVGAISVAFSALVGWLPNIAAGLSVIWLFIQIYEYFKKKYNESKTSKN
jgi:hypothetical protein